MAELPSQEQPKNRFGRYNPPMAKHKGVFERNPGSGVWWIRYYVDGKVRREKVGAKSAAIAAYQKKAVLAREGELPKPAPPLTVSQLLARYQEHFASLRSPLQHVRHQRKIGEAMGALIAAKVTPGDIDRYRREQLKALAPATVNRELAYLRSNYGLAIRDGILKESPFVRLKQLKENNRRTRFLSKDEEVRLLLQLDERSRAIVQLALQTGMRRGELFGMAWSDIDFEHGWINIPRSKSGESRKVPLNNVSSAILLRLQSGQGKYVLQSSRPDRPIDAHNWINRVFIPAVKGTGIVDFRFHDLRHTFCSRLVMAGVSLVTVKELAGHKTMEMTLRYSHLAPGHQKQAIAMLE